MGGAIILLTWGMGEPMYAIQSDHSDYTNLV